MRVTYSVKGMNTAILIAPIAMAYALYYHSWIAAIASISCTAVGFIGSKLTKEITE